MPLTGACGAYGKPRFRRGSSRNCRPTMSSSGEIVGSSDRAYGSWPSVNRDPGFASRYDTPGWRRAEARQREWGGNRARAVRELQARFSKGQSTGKVRRLQASMPVRGCSTTNSVRAP